MEPRTGSDTAICEKALARAQTAPHALGHAELVALLDSRDAALEEEIFAAARAVRQSLGKDRILPRGLIECSNVCAKDCLYCGIRRGNGKVTRYRMSEEAAVKCIDKARECGFGAVAFQAGEIESEANTEYYERLLSHCRGLEVTLSLGEQEENVYRRWKDAGALRYLLRIETSNRELYGSIHPKECSFERRVECLRTLKRLGYVTGSGVMIGLPGQTSEHLADDILFFRDMKLDMVGMGPFIPHPDTPMGKCETADEKERMRLALRMIALTRLMMRDINIVAATALETLDRKSGRQRGIDAGANVVMPEMTPKAESAAYSLYPGKSKAASGRNAQTPC